MLVCRRAKYFPVAHFIEIGEQNFKAGISGRT